MFLSAIAAVLFPFVVSYDAPTNVVNMSNLLDAPAGKHGRVFVKDGRFATSKGPIRFNATNLTGPANFPSHDYAERMADRLARFGVNCVRLHFMDSACGYGNFMQATQACLVAATSVSEFTFDPAKLEKLDYLVNAFKKRGIYVNVNLHVARLMALKGATWFDREIIDSEKDYARRLLSHVNPYTGLSYAQDPVVAMIELNNEDAIFNNCYNSVKAGNARFVRFIMATELAYLEEMKRCLKDEIGAAAPVAASQTTYSPCHVQAVLDYLDHHEYWCHPSPVNKEWKILNAPMVNDPGANCIAWAASRRVKGKPFTISEFNTPYPSFYGAEGHLLLRAYGAFQDWNGVFQYSYDNRVDSEPDHVEYFFSMVARTDVLAHLPACSAMFLRGDVKASPNLLAVGAEKDAFVDRFVKAKTISDDTHTASGGKVPYAEGLVAGVATDLMAQDGVLSGKPLPVEGPVWKSDTGELEWNAAVSNAGYVVCTAANTKFFTGFVKGRTFDLGGVLLKIGKTKLDWATVSLVSHDATGFGESGNPARILLAATGLSRNTGAKVTAHETNPAGWHKISTRAEDWGTGPFLTEGVPAVVTLPSSAVKTQCWALDGHGNRKAELPLDVTSEGLARVVIGPAWETVWYEIEVRE